MPKGNESKLHLLAKKRLFELIKNKSFVVTDDRGNHYEIMNGTHADEFLHIESPILLGSNNAVYSSEVSPCKHYFDRYKDITPDCDLRGYYGAIGTLPCNNCLIGNFGRDIMTSGNRVLSFRPDIAYGYNGIHKVWIEIRNTSPSSYRKKQFCHEHGIILLEIKAESVMGYKESETLLFKRLEYGDKDKSCKELLDEIKRKLDSKIKARGFIDPKDIKKWYYEKLLYKQENIDESYVEFLNDNKLVKYRAKEKAIRHYLDVSNKTIFIREEDVFNFNDIIETYDDYIKEIKESIMVTLCGQIEVNGLMLLSDFKSKYLQLTPAYNKSVSSSEIDEGIHKNGLYHIKNSDELSVKLKTIGINVGKKHLLVNSDVYRKIQKLGYEG